MASSWKAALSKELAETIQEKALRWYIFNVIVKEVVQRYASLMAFQCVSDERDKSEAQDFLVQMGLAKMEVEDDTVAKSGKGDDDAITPHDEGGHPQSASAVPNQFSPVQKKRNDVLLKRRARSELREAMRQQEAADEVFRQIMEDREWVEARRAAEMARERAAAQTKQVSTEKLRKKKEKKKKMKRKNVKEMNASFLLHCRERERKRCERARGVVQRVECHM